METGVGLCLLPLGKGLCKGELNPGGDNNGSKVPSSGGGRDGDEEAVRRRAQEQFQLLLAIHSP